jgi:hypothetical protein
MRRTALIGVLVATALVSGAPAARASDDSVRQVVQEQAVRQSKEDAKFRKAVKTLKTVSQFKKARTATSAMRKSIITFHDAVAGQKADTARVSEGRREMLDALNLYNKGLATFKVALNQAIKSGGDRGGAKARTALNTLLKALGRIEKAAKKIHG